MNNSLSNDSLPSRASAGLLARVGRTLAAGVFALVTVSACSVTNHETKTTNVMTNTTGLLRHVVLFKFKAEATAEQIREIEVAFANLPSQIPQIKAYEWGTDVSPEGLSQGHTHAFIVTFANAADRDAYLPHPAHKEFVNKLLPILDKATVVDFFSKSTP